MKTEIKTVIIGDPHFKVNNVNETGEMHSAIIEFVKQSKPDFIVCLGDILDRHETIHVSPLERATAFLFDLSKLSHLYILIGNHDRPNNSNFLTSEHPFNALKYWNNTTVVDITFDKEFNIVNAEGLQIKKRFLFVPYVPPGRFMEALNKVDDPLSCDCIFAHQEFKGAKMGAITSVEGDEWLTSYPLVISGHIHDFDQLQCNIIYTGTPIQHAFGDRDDKTISLVEFLGAQNERGDKFNHERVNLNLTRKKIVYLKCSEVPFYIPELGVNIKIVASGTSSEIKAIMKLESVKVLASKVKIVYKDLPPEEKLEKIQVTETLTFSQRLLSAISNDLALQAIYNEIFG